MVEDLSQDIAARQGGTSTPIRAMKKGGFAGFFQLLDVGLESGAEHEHHHAQLGEHSEEVTGLDQVEDAGPQQQAGQQRAYHLGHIHPFGKHGKALCDQQDQGHIKK